jgi:hypothetical protein
MIALAPFGFSYCREEVSRESVQEITFSIDSVAVGQMLSLLPAQKSAHMIHRCGRG